MRLSIKETKNKIFYYGLESYRDNDGKVKSRVAIKFGTHDELLKSHDDPKAWVIEEINKINDDRKMSKETFQKKIDYTKKLDGSNNLYSKSICKNVGWLYPYKVLNDLNVRTFFNDFKGKEKYDLFNLFSYLTCARIVNPLSKLGTINDQVNYLTSFDFKKQEAYKILPTLSACSEDLQQHLYNNTKSLIKLDTDVLFYDCTNFYFETDDNDEDLYDLTESSILQYGLRKYGAGKEHRPNPIVQMGLFTDSNGIPIAYNVNPGNTSEQTTVIPTESRIIKEYKNSSFIYCADGGLNSLNIKFLNSINGRKYIVTQSLKKTKKKELDLILKDVNWYTMPVLDSNTKKYVSHKVSINNFKETINKYVNGEELSDEEKKLIEKDMIYKAYPITRKIDLHDVMPESIKKSQIVDFEEILYVTFSAKHYLYQKGILDKQILRAQNILESKSKSTRKMNDPQRFIKENHITDNGEVANTSIKSINNDVIDNEEALLGIYATATNIDPEKKNISDIIAICKKRWKIEYDFRIMKSFLNARPAYVSTHDAIKGHFAICYTALLVYSIIEKKINSYEKHHTADEIINTIRNMSVVKEDEGYYKALFTNSYVLEDLEKAFNLSLSKMYYRNKFFNKIIEK